MCSEKFGIGHNNTVFSGLANESRSLNPLSDNLVFECAEENAFSSCESDVDDDNGNDYDIT